MKNYLTILLAGMFILGACSENQIKEDVSLNIETEMAVASKHCASHEVLQAQLAENPKLQLKLDEIEAFTSRSIALGSAARLGADGSIEIPVYVHVIYRSSSENISDSQINSQIAVLNEDFNANNSDISDVPAEFSGVTADVGVSFVLEGVTRTYNRKRSWRTNDDMKKSSKGGVDPITPETHLNIWVVNRMTSRGGTILGYAQFPGGNLATDGVVVGHNFFGNTGVVSSPFDQGRTTTHEVGHWMNLRHIWGDGGCGASDFVADTPDSDGPNYGCPAYPSVACGSNDMTMNYMDYTDDACMFMFSEGQKDRMLAIFAAGGPRQTMGM